MARPRKQDAIDIKSRAIEIAMTMLSTSPDRLSLLELARRIGCSAPALYAYFDGKDDLLEQLRARALDQLLTETHLAQNHDQAPLAQIGTMAQVITSFAQRHPALYRLIFAPEHSAPTPVIDIDAAIVAPIADLLWSAGCWSDLPGQEQAHRLNETAVMIWYTLHGTIISTLDDQHHDGSTDGGTGAWTRPGTIIAHSLSFVAATCRPGDAPAPKVLDVARWPTPANRITPAFRADLGAHDQSGAPRGGK